MPTPFADIAWPSGARYWLANVRVAACFLVDTAPAASADAEGVVGADLQIGEGRLAVFGGRLRRISGADGGRWSAQSEGSCPC
jgi:hypothetical protein